LVKAFQGAESYYVRGGWGVGFGAGGEHIDIRQYKSSDHFAEEGRFPLIGVDQDLLKVGIPEFYREARESGAGAYVD
jgi:hypothetical protein